MTLRYHSRGLCETCDHDATCTLHRIVQLAVVQCEEFEATKNPALQPAAIAPRMALLDSTEAARMGLCANCGNEPTCALPNARQRVLECEEHTTEDCRHGSRPVIIPAAMAV